MRIVMLTTLIVSVWPTDYKGENLMSSTKYLTKALRCPDGKRKYIRAKTQKELDEKVQRAQLELCMGINIGDNTTFRELTRTWLDFCKRPKVNENTIRLITITLDHHVLPYIGHLRVRDIRPVHIARVMSEAAELAKGTQAALLSRMREVFQFAIDNRVIAVSPVTSQFKPGGTPPAERVPLTEGQVRALLAAAKAKGDDLYVFVCLCLFAGLRRGEALGLCWDSVDFTGRTITVRRQAVFHRSGLELTDRLKTQGAKRVLPIPDVLLEALRQRRRDTDTMTVVGALDMQSAKRITRQLQFLCAVDSGGAVVHKGAALDFYVHPHLLRHTYASRLMATGADLKEVQYLLGHTTPAMTLRVYTHYDKRSRQRETATKVDAAFRPESSAI